MGTRKLVTIDLAEGIKVKHLVIPDMKLIVTVEVDSALQELIDKGKEGLRWSQLADAADDYTDKAKKIIKEELVKFDSIVATLSEVDRKKKVAEIQSVLKQVAAAQEAGVNSAVEKAWQAAVSRKATLKKFKFKCG